MERGYKYNRKLMLEYTDACVEKLKEETECLHCKAIIGHINDIRTAIDILIAQEEHYIETIEKLYLQLQAYEGNKDIFTIK